jgi:hypothetical protein
VYYSAAASLHNSNKLSKVSSPLAGCSSSRSSSGHFQSIVSGLRDAMNRKESADSSQPTRLHSLPSSSSPIALVVAVEIVMG